MSYSTFCVHRGVNTIDSPRNIGLIRLRGTGRGGGGGEGGGGGLAAYLKER